MAEDKKAELKYITSVVKALISSTKPPCLLSEILEDYKAMEYEELPYSKLGYKSPQELLMATGDFSFSHNGNSNAIITAKTSKSSHINEMIKKQKYRVSAKSKKKSKIMNNLDQNEKMSKSVQNANCENITISKSCKKETQSVGKPLSNHPDIDVEVLNDLSKDLGQYHGQFVQKSFELFTDQDLRNNLCEKNSQMNSIEQLCDLAKRLQIIQIETKKDLVNDIKAKPCSNFIDIKNKCLPKDKCENLLKHSEIQKRTNSSNCSFSQDEFLNKVHKKLKRYPHGVFAKSIPKLLGNVFLPENWLTLLKASNKFLVEITIKNTCIIYANSVDESEIETKSGDSYDDAGLQEQEQQYPNIELPWSQDLWNIYITNCISTTQIWGCILDKNYHSRFELLMDEMKLYMDKQKVRARSVKKNYFYLIYLNECWYRVQVKELYITTTKALCLFIDYGHINLSLLSELYECKDEFLTLPVKTAQFSLHGLDAFANNPRAQKCLQKLLNEKEMVAKIFTKEQDFFDNTNTNFKIQTIFFDPSIQDKLTVNDRLVNAICDEISAPEIRENLLTNVLVTKICDDGDIYVQVQNGDFEYIQAIIEKTVRSRLKMDQHNVTHKDLTSNKLFLILDEECNNNVKWYRAELVKNNEVNYLQADSFQLYYIDFGIKRWRNISKIFLLENLSVILKRFPPQAIKVHLYNISNIMIKNSKKIYNLLPINCKAMVKRVKSTLDSDTNSVPLVTVYVQLNDADVFCNVNDVILFEHGLEKCLNNTVQGVTQNICLSLKRIQEFQKTCYTLKRLKDYNSIPNVGSNFDIQVIIAVNPSNFVVHPCEHYEAFQRLMKELDLYYTLNAKMMTVKNIKIGEAYAAQNVEGDYSRVIVLKKSEKFIHINYCDYGYTLLVTSDRLKILPNEFRHLPKMAIKAKLFGIKPTAEPWTSNDCLVFHRLTNNKTFSTIVKGVHDKTIEGTFTKVVELELTDASTDLDVYIQEILLTQ